MGETKTLVAKYWDKHVGEHLGNFENWESTLPVEMRQNYRVTGDKNNKPLDWFVKEYGPFVNAASIGSGTGILERHLCSTSKFKGNVTGYDISPHSVEMAKENCKQFPGANFIVADMNSYTWPKGIYDVVFAHGALHHIESLDWCLGEISNSLKSDGLIYINDYVGPQRFQWSDLQIRMANELLKIVPKQWIKRDRVSRCDQYLLQEQDPSEAVCSHFIETVAAFHFDILEKKPRGGTLLAPIFGSGCLDKSITESAKGLQCISEMAFIEGKLIDLGILPSDHMVIVGRKRKLPIFISALIDSNFEM